MKALVIGPTGLIGNHVVRALLKLGIEVRGFSRGKTPSLNLKDLKLEMHAGDINDASSVAAAMQGCQWVFHTAGYYPTHTFGMKGHIAKAAHQIQTVLNAASRHSIERFIYTSSLTTIGSPPEKGKLADENCPYNINRPPHPYFAVKQLMEEEVKKRSQIDLPGVIVNPTGCFGPYELKPASLCLIPLLLKGKIPAYVRRPINVVDTADVAEGHVLAAQKGRVGHRYILGGHNETSVWIIRTIAMLGGVPPPSIRVPLPLALIPAWVAEGVAYLLKKPPNLSILGLRFLQYGQHYSIDKAKTELGYRVSPMEDCWVRSIEWFKRIGYC